MSIHLRYILHIVSLLLLVIALFMILPLLTGVIYQDSESIRTFFISVMLTLAAGVAGFFITKSRKRSYLTKKDGFLIVVLSWLLASAFGAVPFVLSGEIPSFTDAYFETMSGFTTTGASILTEIESLPKAVLFWRSLTHWLGGMGIVVLMVAILPLLGIGGIKMVSAESPGPTVDKISPKITQMAKLLWYIYMGLTVLETLLLMFGGMDLFDALTHTFGTLATGGFSPKNASVGHYNSAYIDAVITVFMVLAGLNFGLYYKIMIGRIEDIKSNTEFKAYLGIYIGITLLLTFSLLNTVYPSFGESLRYASFQTATVLTTTGYATADFDAWPALSKVLLFILMFIGGCGGSTGGGIKVIRITVLFKQALAEMRYLASPRGIFRVRLNGQAVRKDLVYTIIGFVFLYILFLLITTAVTASGGYGLETSFSTSLVTVGNIGPGFALIGPTQNYAFYQPYIKWFLSLAMLVGRLEVYTVLILFTAHFWKKR